MRGKQRTVHIGDAKGKANSRVFSCEAGYQKNAPFQTRGTPWALCSAARSGEWFQRSLELIQCSEPTEEKGGQLGGQMLSLPLTSAESLRNDMEPGLCSFL